MDNCTNKNDKAYYAMSAAFSLVLFYICVLTDHTCDYSVHAKSMEMTPLRPLLNPLNWFGYFAERGYPLWHITGHFIMRILQCPAEWAAGINSGGWCVLSYVGVIKILRYLLPNAGKRIISVLVFALFIAAPVWLPWKNEYIVLHVGGTNVWHNATNICGRAVGIFAFYYSMKMLDKILESDYTFLPAIKNGIFLSLLYVVSLLAKPSFAQTFAPAFGLLLVFYLVKSKGKFIKQFLLFAAMAILPGLRLIMQFFHYFGTGSGKEGLRTKIIGKGIVFEFPTADALGNILSNQFLVLMFPLIMVIIALAVKRRLDRYHVISWLMLLIGLMCILCLKGAASGEMGWAYYIAAFTVFMVGIRDYLRIFYSEEGLFINIRWKNVLYTVSTIVLIEQFTVGLFYLYELIICGKNIF